jgi:hypothetical protein
MASPQTPPPGREGLEIQVIKSPSLLGEGDLGGEVEALYETDSYSPIFINSE